MTPSPSPESLRAQLLQDPHTAKIAEELGIPVNEYVEQVMHFVEHPHEEPQRLMVEDADLISQSYVPLLDEDMERFLEETTAVPHNMQGAPFPQEKTPPVQPAGEPPASTGQAPRPIRSDLRADLDARLLRGHLDRGDD